MFNIVSSEKITKLIEDRDNLRRALNTIKQNVAFVELTTNGHITWANEKFLSIMGYTFDEIQNRHHSLFCQSGVRGPTEHTLFWSTLAQGHVISDTFARTTQSGTTIWLEATYLPVKDSEGCVERIYKIAADVTNLIDREPTTPGSFELGSLTAAELEQLSAPGIDTALNVALYSSDIVEAISNAIDTLHHLNEQFKNIEHLSKSIVSLSDQSLPSESQTRGRIHENI